MNGVEEERGRCRCCGGKTNGDESAVPVRPVVAAEKRDGLCQSKRCMRSERSSRRN